MKWNVIWSNFAEQQLDEIFEYFVENIGKPTAQKIIFTILVDVEKLEKNPFIGQEEDLLKNRKIKYRYLISTNYKIIYSIDEEKGYVKIVDIFDSRQNPKKIKRKK
ncbi:MAG: type II toxin-antitoxin system RelE/ParE family toxin [Flavobacteriales bacterium]|nr:type II toxin-antitoxin system RelE/ParE family toxin [Flavobacteriales bacterium]